MTNFGKDAEGRCQPTELMFAFVFLVIKRRWGDELHTFGVRLNWAFGLLIIKNDPALLGLGASGHDIVQTGVESCSGIWYSTVVLLRCLCSLHVSDRLRGLRVAGARGARM